MKVYISLRVYMICYDGILFSSLAELKKSYKKVADEG